MARRSINARFFIILLVVALGLGAGTYLVHRLQVNRSARGLLRQADRAEAKGEPAKAAEYIGRYLGYEPADAAARARYALLLADVAEDGRRESLNNAVAALEAALIRDPARADLRRKAAALLLRGNDYNAARSQLETLLGVTPGGRAADARTTDGLLEYQLGRCYEGLKKDEAAIAWYEKARRHPDGEIDAYTRLAALLRKAGKADRADEVMDAREVKDGLIARHPKSFRAHLVRARYRREAGLPGVRDDLERALALGPDEADVILALAQEDEAGDREAARARLERGIRLHPRDPRMYRALVDHETRGGRPREALAGLEMALKQLPKDQDFLYLRAGLLIELGELDRAAEAMGPLREAGLPPGSLTELDARLLIARGEWIKAAQLLERSLPAQADQPAQSRRTLLLLADCYRRAGEPDRRFEALRRAVEADPPDGFMELQARREYGQALANLDRIDEAIDEYRKALRLPGATVQDRIFLTRLLAVQTLREPEPRRDWAEVDRAMDDIDQAIPGNPAAAALRAEVMVARGRADEGIRILDKAQKLAPDRVDLRLALAAMVQRAGDQDRALALLDDSGAKPGDRPLLLLGQALYWAARGGPEAVAALSALEGKIPGAGGEASKPLLAALADAYRRVGEPRRARGIYERLAAEKPDDLGLRKTIFELALQDGEVQDAERALAKIKELDADGSQWRWARAALLIEQARRGDLRPLDEASRLLDEVAAQRPSWSAAQVSLGMIADLRKDPTAALVHYRKAIDLGDRSPLPIRRAAQILSEQKNYDQAELVLRKLQDQSTTVADLRRPEEPPRTFDYDRELEKARLAAKAEPDSTRNRVWLGRLLGAVAAREAAAGRADKAKVLREEAETTLTRAVERDDKSPEAWISLVQALAAAGKKDDAVAAVDRAEKALAGRSEWVALAGCAYEAGQADRAEEILRQALVAKPDDPAILQAVAASHLRRGRLRDAEPHLQKLVDTARTPADKARARRILALVMAAEGDHKKAKQALGLLAEGSGDKASGGPGDADVERRTRARVLALQKGRAPRREAIQVYRELAESPGAQPADLLMLARLLEADGDWPAAREVWRRIVGSKAASPELMVLCILSQLRHGDLEEARPLLAKLEAARPDSPPTVELKARFLAREGRGEEATRIVEAFLSKDAGQVAGFAALLEELGQVAAAERLYRRAATGGALPTLQLAGFLGRHNRVPEALDLLDSPILKGVPAEQLSNTALTIVYGAKAGDEAQYRRVERRIVEALKAHPETTSLRFDLANLRCLQGRFDEAGEIFLQIIKEEPSNPSPRNNLAWMLALRGRGDQALEYINSAVELGGETPDVLDTRALVFLARGQAEPAIRDMEDCLVLGETAEKQFHLARAYRLAGKTQEAGRAFARAKELGLTAQAVHPLERPAFAQLQGDTARR